MTTIISAINCFYRASLMFEMLLEKCATTIGNN